MILTTKTPATLLRSSKTACRCLCTTRKFHGTSPRPNRHRAKVTLPERSAGDVYDKTRPNLRIDENTRVIYQGFTGKAATANAQDTIAYGTRIVGGVSPGKGGQTHLDLPVFNTVAEAMSEVRPDVSSVFVPAQFAAAAILEAIEAEVPLVVSVAEHIPVHDMLRVQEVLRMQSKTRLVGPNCPGIIAPDQCRVGIMPYKQFMRGCVGIVSKSGTLSYEAVGATTEAGLGQSLVIGMGGDLLPGTTLVDGLKIFFDDDETKGIILIGEIGGKAENEAAQLIREYHETTANPKPIVAMVAGQEARPHRTMGHAGAMRHPQAGEMSSQEKIRLLKRAGAHIVPHPGELGTKMKELLEKKESLGISSAIDLLYASTRRTHS